MGHFPKSALTPALFARLGRVPSLLVLCVALLLSSVGGAAHAMGSSAERILFVGRAFELHPGVAREVGNIANALYRFDTPPISVRFYSETPPDLEYVQSALTKFTPALVVISAFEERRGELGQGHTLRANLAAVAELARESGAEVMLLAHPPTKPDRAIGYGASVARNESMTAVVADQTGAQLVRTGALFGSAPVDDVASLYGPHGRVFSGTGQRAVGLSIAMGMGIDVRAMLYAEGEEQPEDLWLERAEDWAVETGLRPAVVPVLTQ